MTKIESIAQQEIIKDPENKALMRLFGMINTYPQNATFATQNEGESIVIILRKHFITNFGWIINSALLFIAPTIVDIIFRFIDTSFFKNQLSASAFISGFSNSLGLVFLLFYYGICASTMLFNFIHWYYDLFVITTERFISLDFDVIKGLTTIDIPLHDIIDISEKVQGFWPTFFGYGSVEFKTTSQKFVLIENIPQTTWFRDSFADLIRFIRENDREEEISDYEHEAVALEKSSVKKRKNTAARSAKNLEP